MVAKRTTENSLAAVNPELAKQWHPTMNGDLTPNDVTTGSSKKVWWLCEKGHMWEAVIGKRIIGHNCPYCSGQRVCIDNCLQTLNPELATQWHPTKNGDLTPNDVTTGSSKKVWWLCEKGDGHEWDAKIVDRAKGKGCPFCAGKRACVDNCLQTLNPELAKQWHPTKNGKLTQKNVTTGSDKKAWWICEKGHDDWIATISSRIQGSGCPTCSKEKQSSFQEQAIYFYMKSVFNDALNRYKLNNKWEIDIFVPSLNFGIEYDGLYHHQGKRASDSKKEKAIANEGVHLLRVKETRKKLSKCYLENNIVYCSKMPSDSQLDEIASACLDYISKKITHKPHIADIDIKRDRAKIYALYIECEKNESLFAKYPELSNQWHPTRNFIKPTEVRPRSDKIVWWKCEKGIDHEWVARVESRTRGNGCPYCSGRFACADNCLQTLNPELAKQWHPTLNGDKTPNDVTISSDKKVWWQCEKVKEHEWDARIADRTKGCGCPYCSGKRVCADNCLQTLNPELAKQWHPTENGDLMPNNVTAFSNRDVWWLCETGHEWKVKVSKRSNGEGCPYCSGKRVCADNCLQTLRPDLAKQWHPTLNDELTPNDVTPGMGRDVWWQCEKGVDHVWRATVNHRNNGSGCPYCAGKRVCSDNSLQTLKPELAKEWHPIRNKDLTPDKVTAGSSKKVWWLCENGHEWEAVIYNRVKRNDCPKCRQERR